MTDTAWCALDDLATLRIQGADAARFLQGQLSNDLNLLRPGRILRAGLHNPQGRTLALLWLAQLSDGGILACLPSELAPGIAAQLRRYVLRAKVAISEESTHGRIIGYQGAGAAAVAGAWLFDADRAVAMQPRSAPAPGGPQLSRDQWRALDVARGLPQVHAATSGQFVAQMLNLDCIEAVSFDKGCYTGQEVIARAHFRGRVKRRMQRFVTRAAVQLTPGDTGTLPDGRSFRVVESAPTPEGGLEFLAVASLAAEESAAAADGAAAPPLAATYLPLPYPLPD